MTPPPLEWSPEGGRGPGHRLPRELDVEKLVAVERAAVAAGEPVARFWRDLAASAETAVTPHSLDTLFRDSLQAMIRLLGVNTVAILLANETGDELVARAAIGLSEELTLGLGIRAGEGMAGRVLASRRPLLVGDLSAIHVVNPVLRDSGLRSVVAVPLLAGGHPLGVMYAASYEQDRFTEPDASLMELLADRLAAALDRVRLFERERAARRQAERLADRIGRMQRVTATFTSSATVEELAAALTGALVEEADGGSPWWAAVWLLDRTSLVPVHHSTHGAPLPAPVAMDLGADRTPAVAARRRRAVYLAGPKAPPRTVGHLLVGHGPPSIDPDVSPDEPEEPFAGGAFAAVPILSEDGCFGVLGLAYAGWRPFDADEREFIDAVVRQASLALDRARLSAEREHLAAMANFYAMAARELADASDLRETLERLADLSLQALGEICSIDMFDEDGRIVRMVAKHRDPALQPIVDRLRDEFTPELVGWHPAAEVLRSGVTRWSDHLGIEFLRGASPDPDHFALAQALGYRSYVTVPIVAGGGVMGALTVVSTSRSFAPDDVAMAEQLAHQVAGLIDNARRFDTAAHTSRVLQASLLPRQLPQVPGLSIHSRYLAGARALEVGGDFYDVYRLPTGQVAFAIGDVAGHDRSAAALMGHVRTATRALAGHTGCPAALVDAVRGTWSVLEFDRIATAIVGAVDPGTGAVALASAGHYPPLLVDGGPTATYLPLRPGPPFGVPAGPAVQWEGTLAAGQLLLLYTDGAVDERGTGIEASMAALAVAAAVPSPDPATVCDRVVARLTADRVDDAALLALRFDGPR